MSNGVFRWGDGDSQAEGLELVDVAGDLAVPADAVVVEVRSEVVEPGFGVDEQVEDDHQDGAATAVMALRLPRRRARRR